MGIGVGKPKLDLSAMMKYKDEGVDSNVKGIAFLFKKNKVDSFRGVGRIAAPGKVEVNGADGKAQTLDAKSRSTRSASCPRPVGWFSTRCRNGSWWSAPA
jgi:dihydrolipoamide dehydrogenase